MRECNRSAFFSKRVYWTTIPFLAVAMIVRTTCEIFEAAAADKGVKLICTTPSSPAIITAHAYRLQRLIGNLLDNALKFTPAGGEINVVLSTSASDLNLIVADTGIGMTPEERAHIFERFYRADKSRHTPGFGLGLTLVHATVAFYRGTISVTSAPAHGTTFTISLPTVETSDFKSDASADYAISPTALTIFTTEYRQLA